MSFVYQYGCCRDLFSQIRLFKNQKYEKENTLLHAAAQTQHKERAFFPPPRMQGSLTIEAAAALPLFLLFVIGMISFLLLFSLQMDIQNGMEESARSLTRKAYLAETSEADAGLLTPGAVTLELLTGPVGNRVEHSGIAGGKTGLNALLSGYDRESGILDVVVHYVYRFPVIPGRNADVHFMQRIRSRAWIGRELDTCGASGSKHQQKDSASDPKTVYVAENGSVYHTSKDCHYLDLSIRMVRKDRVTELRNQSGSRYGCCPLCGKKAAYDGNVYVTGYGENWHTSLACSGLKRTVREVDIEDVGQLPLCSKCGKRH